MSVGWDVVPTTGLGVCVGAQALVPGDVDGLRQFAGQLHRTGAGARRVVALLAAVDAGRWVGRSGEAFTAAVAAQPVPWVALADALTAVSTAAHAYADAVEDARVVAGRAMAVWESGEHASAAWRAQQAAHAAAHSGVGSLLLAPLGAPPPVPPPALDPGEPVRQQAQRLYDGALDDVRVAADALVRVLRDATAAPRSTAERWGAVAGGAWASASAGAALGWRLTGGAVLDPDEGRASWAALAGGLAHAVGHPREAFDEAVAVLDGDPDAVVGGALPGLLGGALGLTGRVAAGGPRLSEPGLPQALPEVGAPARPGPVLPGQRPDAVVAPLTPAQRQELAERVASGHAWDKHRLDMPWLADQRAFADYLGGVMATTPVRFEADAHRRLFWDPEHGVFLSAQTHAEGTAFSPRQGYDYYWKQVFMATSEVTP